MRLRASRSRFAHELIIDGPCVIRVSGSTTGASLNALINYNFSRKWRGIPYPTHKIDTMGRRPDSTQAPIPIWGEYDTGMESSAAPPPYSIESSAASRPTPSRSSSNQKYECVAPSSTDPSNAYSNIGPASASSSLLELDAGEGSIPPPGDTGVTRMYTGQVHEFS